MLDFSRSRIIVQELKVKSQHIAILHFLDEKGVKPFLAVSDGFVFANFDQVLLLLR